MAPLFYAVWCAGIVLKGAAACRMAWNGLARKLPLLWVFLALCVARSIALLALRPHAAAYLNVYSATLPFSLLAECAAIIALFWTIAANYVNFRLFGSILLSGFAILGVSAASITCFVAFPSGVKTLQDAMLLAQRNTSIVMVVVLAGARFTVPRSPRIPVPVNAHRAADLLVLDAALGIASAWFARIYGYTYPGVTAFLPTLFGLLLGALWLLAMSPAETERTIGRTPEELAREMRAAELAILRATADVRGAARLLSGD